MVSGMIRAQEDFGAQGVGHGESVGAGHVDVQREDVRTFAPDGLEGVGAVGGGGDRLQPGASANSRCKPSKQTVIVRGHQAGSDPGYP